MAIEYVEETLISLGGGWHLATFEQRGDSIFQTPLWLVLHGCTEPMQTQVGFDRQLVCQECGAHAGRDTLDRANWHARRLGGKTAWSRLK